MRLKNITAISAITILCLSLLTACAAQSGGDDSKLSDTPPPPSAASVPGGVLLLGGDNDNALAKTQSLSPTPVNPSQIKANGFLSTRLDAVINPTATVAEVNAALESVDVKIDGMAANSPIVTLNIPEVTNRAAAQAIADTLQANNAFAFVTVTFEAKTLTQGTDKTASSILPTPLKPYAREQASFQANGWFQAARFKALWGADAVATAVNQPVTISIPSNYAANASTDSSNIPNLSFLDGFVGGIFLVNYGDDETDPVLGSYGYTIASMIGVYDSTPFVGAYPQINNNLLTIYAAPLTGLSYTGIVNAIFQSTKDALADEEPHSHKHILLTQHVYEDDDFSDRSRIWRAIDALNWRRTGGGFLHITSVGELGDSTGPASQAKYSSPFAISEAYPELGQFILEDPDLDPNSAAVLDFIELRFTLSNPPPIGNLLTVGSSRLDQYTRSDFSTPGADVRMIGEDVEVSCYTESENCVDNQWIMSDTGLAAAQVAALAAWMFNMDSTLNETDVMTAIKHAYQNGQLVGIVDTYAALLSLDTSITEAPIRKSILDVTDTHSTGARDGQFDEGDIDYWFNTILPTFADGFPFDLNGDGHIGGSDTAWFDLDINALPVYTTVTQTIGDQEVSFNEEAITDFDVLCYYAYSDLYTGDTASRDALILAGCTSSPVNAFEFTEFKYNIETNATYQNNTITDNANDTITDWFELLLFPGGFKNNLAYGENPAYASVARTSLVLEQNFYPESFEIKIKAPIRAETPYAESFSADVLVKGSYQFNLSAPTNYTLTADLDNRLDNPERFISTPGVLIRLNGNPIVNIPDLSEFTEGLKSYTNSGVLPAGSHILDLQCAANVPEIDFDIDKGGSAGSISNRCEVTLSLELNGQDILR